MAPRAVCHRLLWFELTGALSKNRFSLVLRAGPGMAQGERKKRTHFFLMENRFERGKNEKYRGMKPQKSQQSSWRLIQAWPPTKDHPTTPPRFPPACHRLHLHEHSTVILPPAL